MAEIQFNVNMDLVDKYVPAEDITIPQEDNLSVKFTYSIFNREEIEDLTGATDVVVSYVKPDGHIVLQSNGTLELPNKVSIVANAQAFTYVGKVYMQVQYKKGTNTFNTRQAFFWVERSNTSCQTVASADFAPYLDNVVATGEMLDGLDLQALIDSKQTAEGAQADVNGIKPRVLALEVDVASLKSRMTVAEGTISTQGARIIALENSQGSFNTRITNVESKNTQQDTRLSTLETEQATQGSKLNAVENKNTTQDTRLTDLELFQSDATTKDVTQDSRLTSIEIKNTSQDSSISAIETKNTEQDARLLSLEQSQPDLAPINTRITNVENKNTAQDNRLGDLETAKAANDTKNSTQDARLTSLENDASSLSSAVTTNKAAQDTVNTNVSNSISGLSTRVTTNETKNSQQDTRLDTAESKNAIQDTKIASLEGANSVIIADINALETLTGEHEGRLDINDTKNASQDSLIASNSSAISSLTTTVNNNQTGMNSRVTALETAKVANDTKNTQQDNRLTALENYDTTQDTRMTAIEGINTTQNTRLTTIESKNTEQDTKIDSTKELLDATNQGEKVNLDGGIRLGIRPKTPIITFTSDDGRIEDYTKIKPLFQAKGVPLTMGLIPGLSYDNPNRTSVAQLKELLGIGWELASHTYNHPNLATLTDQQIDDELRMSKEALETTFEIPIDHIIYPYGGHDSRVRKIARKYYRSGTSTDPGYNGMVHRMYSLQRVAFGSYFDVATPGYPATNTLEYYKQRVDDAISNNGWLIFMMHPWSPDHDAIQQQHLSDLVDYIQSKNIPTMTIKNSLDRVGNLMDVGDYGDMNGFFALGSTGKLETNYAYKRNMPTGLNANSPLSAFEPRVVSAITFSGSDNGGFPDDAGTLEVYRLSGDDYAFQQFYHYGSDRVYKRRWDVVTSSWLPWVRLDPNVITSSTNAYGATTPITSFPSGKMTYTRITSAGASGLPSSNGGTLITNAIVLSSGYARQTFYNYNDSGQHERYVTEAGSWSDWEKVSRRIGTTFNSFNFGTIPANGQVEMTMNIPGVRTSDIAVATPRVALEPGLMWAAYVNAVDTVIVRVVNVTTSSISSPSRQWSISVTR
ncbi:polysaccharide deacetylase family protein [Bacillus thuringiensis]|uniref:polysaccharide deacetylase family protein n=1 Tax=Bacillus thuringiensis TaxID=1428 RepID=UPI000BFC8196|nr:polysaccharide deacetylase family protein [Bacillus thuringiensis]PGM47397.1 hypothetical protein CN937_03760 [Bacillus thuringiensis]